MSTAPDAQEAAQDGIAAALGTLPPDDAMEALLEVQAMLIADAGLIPRTPEFDAFITRYLTRLCGRVMVLRQVMRAGAH